MWPEALFIPCAYLVGALPHLRVMVKAQGLNAEGDLHLKLLKHGGLRLAVLGVVIDIAKGALVILVGRLLNLEISILAFAGLAVVSGQIWPIFGRFDGEKGNSTGLGMVLALTPLPALIALIPILAGVIIKFLPYLSMGQRTARKARRQELPPSLSLPLCRFIGFLVLPFASYWLGEPPVVFWSYGALALLIIIRRSTAGLSRDGKTGGNLFRRLFNRALFDRPEI